MSSRVLSQWDDKTLLHTAIDDLESIVWVLFYEILASSEKSTLTKQESQSLRHLLSNNLEQVEYCKVAIRSNLYLTFIPSHWSGPIKTYKKLLMPLFGLTIDASNAVQRCLKRLQRSNCHPGSTKYWEGLDTVCDEYFKKYINAILEYLDDDEEYDSSS